MHWRDRPAARITFEIKQCAKPKVRSAQSLKLLLAKLKLVSQVPIPQLGLGLGLWQGEYEGIEGLWLRWRDVEGEWIPTFAQQAELERQRAEQALQLELERQRAEQLADRLRVVQGREASVETTAGIKQGRIFRDVELCIGDRRGTFDCLELTEVDYPLLGVTPMETLGLEPDLQNRKLRVLPMSSEAFLPQHFVIDSRAIDSFLAPATIHQRGLLTGHIV